MTKELQDLRVLVAEDDFLIASYLEGLLRDRGADVTLISTVSELKKADADKFDVAILDNTLADGEIGSEVSRLHASGLPLIGQSGGDGGGADISGLFIARLGKPISEDELFKALNVYGKSVQPRPE